MFKYPSPKFLKTDQYEKRLIVNLLEKYVIAYPSISFHFSIDGKKVFDTSGNGAQREVLMSILGFQNSKLMLDVAFEEDGTSVFGFVSPPGLTRSNRREITFFINGRWIQDVALGAALIRAYHTYLMVGRYPIAWLFLQIPPAEVDINVHPTKAEVRLKNPDRIFSLVQRAVRFALMNANLPRFDNEPKWRFLQKRQEMLRNFQTWQIRILCQRKEILKMLKIKDKQSVYTI